MLSAGLALLAVAEIRRRRRPQRQRRTVLPVLWQDLLGLAHVPLRCEQRDPSASASAAGGVRVSSRAGFECRVRVALSLCSVTSALPRISRPVPFSRDSAA